MRKALSSLPLPNYIFLKYSYLSRSGPNSFICYSSFSQKCLLNTYCTLGPELSMEDLSMNGQQNVSILQKENTYPGELGVSEKILQDLFVCIFKLALC